MTKETNEGNADHSSKVNSNEKASNSKMNNSDSQDDNSTLYPKK